jgi:hypothetical protein
MSNDADSLLNSPAIKNVLTALEMLYGGKFSVRFYKPPEIFGFNISRKLAIAGFGYETKDFSFIKLTKELTLDETQQKILSACRDHIQTRIKELQTILASVEALGEI